MSYCDMILLEKQFVYIGVRNKIYQITSIYLLGIK